jgi:hypothetical protein
MKILYKNNNKLILMASALPEIDIHVIAEKDVPSGLLYKLVDESELPSLETFYAWEMEINESNADGIGLTKEQFEVKYPEYKDWYVV